MKWFVYGFEIDKNGGCKIVGEVHTIIEDVAGATQTANAKYGYDTVNYVARASHLEIDGSGKTIVVYE